MRQRTADLALTNAQLSRSEKRYRSLVENMPLGVTVIDKDHNIVMTNKALADMFQQPPNWAVGCKCHQEYRKRDAPCTGCVGSGAMIGGITEQFFSVKREDGSPTEVHIRAFPYFDESGRTDGFVEIVEDITERKQAEEALRLSALRHRQLFESSRYAQMTLAPPSWQFTEANQATLQLFGASSAVQFTALGLGDISPQRQPDGRPSSEKAQEMIETAIREGSQFFEWEHQRLDDQPFAADVLLTRMHVGEAVFLQATVRDITERKRLEEELKRHARIDMLTGINNRRHFFDLAERELARAKRYGTPLTALMLDLDNFKLVNDTYGHQVGDMALQKLTEVCVASLRGIDILGRIGGEEFAILMPQTESEQALEVAERLRLAIATAAVPLAQNDPLHFTVSIGAASFVTTDATVDDLLKRADRALYTAKNTGRNRVCYGAVTGVAPLNKTV